MRRPAGPSEPPFSLVAWPVLSVLAASSVRFPLPQCVRLQVPVWWLSARLTDTKYVSFCRRSPERRSGCGSLETRQSALLVKGGGGADRRTWGERGAPDTGRAVGELMEMAQPVDGERALAVPPGKLRFSLSPAQLEWLEDQSRLRGVDKSTLLSEIFERGVALPARAPPAGGARAVLGVPTAVVGSAAVGAGASSPSSLPSAPSPGPAPALARRSALPDAPPASADPTSPELPDGRAAQSGVPPWQSWSPAAPAGGVGPAGLPRGAIVLVPGHDGRYAPVSVSPDLFERTARGGGAVASFYRMSRVTRCLIVAGVRLVLAGLGLLAGMGVLSSRYEFREVATSPGPVGLLPRRHLDR